MATPKDVLSDPAIQEAVIRAKAIAIARGQRELSVELFLVGCHHLVGDPQGKDISSFAGKADAISMAVAHFPVPPGLDLAAAAATRMPLKDTLRRILAASRSSVGELLDSLLEAMVPDGGHHSALFDAVVRRASAAAKTLGLGEVDDGLFAVAAHHAYLAGEFLQHVELSVHMATNREALETLEKARGWSSASFATVGADALPLSDEFSKKLSDAKASRLLTGINLGATEGAKLRQLRVTAVHEAGHAVIWFVLRPQAPIAQVSIIPSGDSEGRMSWDPTASYLALPNTKRFFLDDTCIALAGNLAMAIEYGADAMDGGGLGDFSHATFTVWRAVAQLGLDEEFGPVNLQAFAEFSGSSTGWLHDRAQERVQQILKECASRTRALLRENWHHVEAVTEALMQHKTLGTAELLRLLVDKGLADWPGVRHVRSVPTRREARFATSPGVHASREGPVQFAVGDVLVTGADGETWPIPRDVFEAGYEPVAPLVMGEDGAYIKRGRSALALQLNEARKIVMSRGRGVLAGEAGDWIVDYGGGDLAVVSSELFPRYYELVV